MDDPLVGSRLGSYRIEAALGRGGMGRVYRARDVNLDRVVAVKVLEPGLHGDPGYAARFRQEAQAVAGLDHPHIVPVYFFGEQDGLYYLVMKYSESADLTTLIAHYAAGGETPPLEDVLRIAEAIGGALDYAHGKGVIHRDVKPANILLDRDGRPYLTDFGLALDVDRGTVGAAFGTPHYIAPEQARSSAKAVPASDLYSLGVVLYELLTGMIPFDDPAPAVVALKHLKETPPPPRVFNPRLAPQVEAVIVRALAKRPKERYSSGVALAQALRAAVQESGGGLLPDETLAALPPLPPGVSLPAARRTSQKPVAEQVRLTLAAPPSPATMPSAPTPESAPPAVQPRPRSRRLPAWMALLALIGVLAAVLLAAQQGSIIPAGGQAATTPRGRSTPAPEGWLPVRFVYGPDSFYWLNDSGRTLSSENIAFERAGGPQRFDGRRWASWMVMDGRCMEIVFDDVANPVQPEGCRPNSWYRPARIQDLDFWTGSGQFWVIWRGQAVALCDNEAGACSASLPPGL